jgi:hypothetical protein
MTNALMNSTADLAKMWDELANDGANYNFPLGFDRLKLNGQTGEYLSPGRPGEDLTGLRLIFDLENVHEGHTLWDGQRPLERWIVPWPQKPPPRAELPMRDEAEWPIGLSGKAEDPIKLAIYTPCYGESGPERFILICGNRSQIQGVRQLRNAWLPYRGQGLPVVELHAEAVIRIPSD